MKHEEPQNHHNVLRYFTVPASLASVGLTIAAAELVSPVLMFVAAGVGAAGAASLIFSGITGRPMAGRSNGTHPASPLKQTAEPPMVARY